MSAKEAPQKNLYFCIFSGWALTSSSVVVIRSVSVPNRSVLDVIIVIMVMKYYKMCRRMYLMNQLCVFCYLKLFVAMKILQGLARSTQVLDRSSAACGMELSAYDQFYYLLL